MKLMLDTNICIAIIKKKPRDILQKFSAYQIGDICISSVTLAELRYGVAKSQFKEKNQAALDEFILPLEVVDFDEPATEYYGTLRATLEKQGIPIGPLDTMIGAHALSLNVTLVSNNTKEFSRITGIKLVDWISC
ncbi:MAG: type II toxin-antitoxin system VapC family toxin [Methylotenera sp.]|uniref:type II toxin-antitoxin system tRNA(fMet)-specific endonuclease VapC n=1 Tax=Methylotenera sp. TaxID=2051956 RepID=UPI002488AE29|nr:type II toxin-antitoxin system VapC family toxin [Methylotenera sp.]MDI1298770.1 type II toxin-antitoxin system VapC family toxin [Methylotenera sp.]MDI1307908.1 type II toxin-antitoxin system VapC family toxin [Methylotenera sp.]